MPYTENKAGAIIFGVGAIFANPFCGNSVIKLCSIFSRKINISRLFVAINVGYRTESLIPIIAGIIYGLIIVHATDS